jgi:microcystin-dependent protein
MPGTIEKLARFKWPESEGEVGADLKRSYVLEAETVRRAFLDVVWRIAKDGVTRDCLGYGAIAESKLAEALVAEMDLADGTVTTRKFANGAFATLVKMADLFATGAKFEDGAVTLAKLATAVGAYVIPPGAQAWFGGETAPAGWLPCDGGERLIADYPDLAGACGTRWGTAPSGPLYFKLPDWRGYFSRGWADAATTDPDKLTRTGGNHVGSTQGQKFGEHGGVGVTWQHRALATSFANQDFTAGALVMAYNTTPGAATVNANTGTETRPKNKAVLRIIKT